MADAPPRSAEQLIAALEAGEIDPREFLLEARALRSDDELLLPDALRDALFDRLPALAPIIGQNGGIGTVRCRKRSLPFDQRCSSSCTSPHITRSRRRAPSAGGATGPAASSSFS